MAGENGLLMENEKQANKIAAKVMRITFFLFTVVYLLDVIGIFTVRIGIMTIAYIGGSVLLLLPTLLVNVLKKQGGYIKYLNVISAAVFVTLLSITITYHVVAIYVYPIAIASLYFSKKLNNMATALTVIGVSVGQILAFYLKTLQDNNFLELKKVIVFGVIPRALVLIAVAAIFTMLCSRTAALLSNLMGAEEQVEMLDKMKRMKENAGQTSKTMVQMVTDLSGITESSLQANQRIAEESGRLLSGSMENTEAVENADGRMQDIAGQLKELGEMNHKTAVLTDRIEENTQENQKRMVDATASMQQINDSTNTCKQIISKLGEESKEIVGIVETITNISSRTKILALNATIEAARAGEQGKGFAVVAEEIQNLSGQTKTAVESIGEIVHQVVANTKEAVEAMEKNADYTKDGTDSIQKANESAALITVSNEELGKQIHEIEKVAEIIRNKSGEIVEDMRQIRENTKENCGAVEHVTAASQENSAGTEKLDQIVRQIRELTEQLNQVVQA